MANTVNVRPKSAGCVIGLGMGRFAFVGKGVALVIAASIPLCALGAPQGAQVTSGSASIRQNGNTTVIRASDGSIINYSTFNVGSNETVRFIQPNSGSRVLNRVNDGASVIDGTIKANGIVYIVNSAGIYFGKGAFVDVGQIYAGAGTITNADFANRRDRFQDVHGEVVNQGTIQAGSASLIGQKVANLGSITADRGVIAMVSGDNVTLQRRGDTMSVKVSQQALNTPRAGDTPRVDNSGTLTARRGSVLMAAGDMVSLAVRNTGSVTARDVSIEAKGRGGVEVSGTIDASNQTFGQRGGNVAITGQDVQLTGATINASGNNGGGTVAVGGNVHGQGEVRNATSTSVDSASSIRADAIQQGSGGTISVWSDGHTTFAGSASASGGASGGDGGFIETSGLQAIDFGGANVMARAGSGGKAGTWLIDPVGTVTIDASAASSIKTSLEGGMNVTLDTAVNGTSGAEDINFTAPIATTTGSGGILTLNAGNNINVTQSITASGGGSFNLSLNAGNNVNVTAAVSTGGGFFHSSGLNFTSSGSGTIATSGGGIVLNHDSLATINATMNASGGGNNGAVSITASDVAIGSAVTSGSTGSISLLPAIGVAQVRLSNGAGDFNLSSAELSNLAPGSAGVVIGNSATPLNLGSTAPISQGYSLTLNGSTITFNDAVTLTGASRTLTLNAATVTDNHSGTDVNVAGSGGTLAMNVSGSGSLGTNVVSFSSNSAGGIVSIQEVSAVDFGNVTAGTLTITAGGSITDSGVLTIGSGGASFTTLVDLGAPITLNTPTSTFAGPVTLQSLTANGLSTASGAITLVSNSALGLAGVQTTSSGTFSANGNITDSGTVGIGGAAGFTTTGSAGTINLSHLALGSGALTLNTSGASGAGDATIVNNGAFSLASSSIKGALNATATGGTLTVSGPVTVGGGATLTASDFAITSTLSAGSAGISLSPDTVGATISVNDATAATMNLTAAELANLTTTGTVTIGRADGTGAINIGGSGAINLSSGGLNKNYNLSFAGGPLSINGALTLFSGKILTLQANGVTGNSGGTDITIGGAGKLVVDSGAAVTLTTAIAQVAARTTAGGLTIHNTGSDLDVTSLANGVTLSLITGVSAGGGGLVDLSSTGTLTVDSAILTTGMAHIVADGNIAVTTSGAGISADTLTLTSTNGMISNGSGGLAKTAVATMLTASGKTGIAMNNTGSITAVLTALTGPITFTNSGTLTIASGTAISSGGNPITLSVGDLVLGGGGFNIDAGASTVTIGSSGMAGTIDIGDVTGSTADVKIDNTELAAIRAATLTIGDTATKALGASGLTVAATMDIGQLNLRALDNAGRITLTDTGTASIYKNLDARANNGIAISKGFTVTSGDLYLDGDADSAAAMTTPMDNITIAAGTTFGTTSPSGGNVTLKAATGGITGAGAFTVTSNGSLELDGAMSGQGVTLTGNNGVMVNGNLTSTTGAVLINADADADGTGTFTLTSGKNITTTNQNLTIFAADVNLQGTNTIDAGTAEIVVAQSKAAGIWLGNVGGAPSGDLKLDQSELVSFKARALQIGSDKANLMTVNGVDLTFITGTLDLVADDIHITGMLKTENSGLSITRGNTGTIGVGSATGDMTVDHTELAFIQAHGFNIGGGGASDITVDGVTSSDVMGIVGVTGFVAANSLTFSGGASSFSALSGIAGNGVVVNANLTTAPGGDLVLDGGGGMAGVSFGAGRTLVSGNDLTISASGSVLTGAGALTLTAGRSITLNGALTTSGVTTITADSDADGAGIMNLSGVTTNSNALLLSGAGLTLAGAIQTGTAATTIARSTAGTIQLGDFTKGTGNSPTTFTITGTELGLISTTGLTLGGATTTALNVKDVQAEQSQNLLGTTKLLAQGASGDVSFTGTESTFGNLNVTAADTITNSATAGLTSSGSVNLNAGTSITSSRATVLNDLNLVAGTTIATNDTIQVGQAINLTAGTGITVGGFLQSRGGDIALDAGTGAGHTIRLENNVNAASTRQVEFKSAVEVARQVTVFGHTIKFDGTVDSDATQTRILNVNTGNNGTATFSAAVGGTHALQQLVTGSDGTTILNADVNSKYRMFFGNKVELTNNVTVKSRLSGITFGGTIDGDTSGTRDLTVLVDRATPTTITGLISTIFFGADVGSTHPLHNLFLNYRASGPAIDGRDNVSPVASIVARKLDVTNGHVALDPGAFSITFNVDGTFRMGKNEKFTAVGDLRINAGTAIIGDITTLGDLTVDSANISIMRRAAAQLLGSTDNADSGVLMDAGVDYVAGGVIDFTSAPTLIGTGAAPEFGTPDGQRGPSAGTLSPYLFRQIGDLTFSQLSFASDFPSGTGTVTSRTLDLPATGPSSTDPSTVRAGAIPRETRQNQVGQDTTISQASKDELRNNFNIFARDPSGAELLQLITGGALYDDVPKAKGLRPTAQDFTTVTTRLPSAAVEDLVAAYRDTFSMPELGEDGKPVVDPKTGHPKYVSRTQKIKDAIGKSVERFARGKSGDIDPRAFRAYVENTPEEAETRGYLAQIGEFIAKLDTVGLTPRETRQARTAILSSVRPKRITKPEIFEAIIRSEPVPARVGLLFKAE